MAFSPTSFINNGLKYGGQRPNLFRVTLDNSNNIFDSTIIPGYDNQKYTDSFNFQIQSVVFPSSNLGEMQQQVLGFDYYFVGDREFEPVTITVIHDSKNNMRKFFEGWINFIHGGFFHSPNNEFVGTLGYGEHESMKDYTTGMKIETFSKIGEDVVTSTVNLTQVWPINLSEMSYSHDSSNEYMVFDVELRYLTYTIEFNTENFV